VARPQRWSAALAYAEQQERVVAQLSMQSRTKVLHRDWGVLADSPLVLVHLRFSGGGIHP
jgi:ABC-type phosphonate transport system ATPase subunit